MAALPAPSPHLQEVLLAPGHAKLVGLPLLVDRQQREVVALRLEELGLLLVRLGLLLLGPVVEGAGGK